MKVIAPELRLATCWDLFRAWIGYPQLHVFESGQDDDEYVYEALERHNQLRKVRYPYTYREISSSLISINTGQGIVPKQSYPSQQ